MPILAQETPRVASTSASGHAAVGFDQLISFGQVAPISSATFHEQFQKVAKQRFDVKKALAALEHDRMELVEAPGGPKSSPPLMIARHYIYGESRIRVDEVNSQVTYFVDCDSATVTVLDQRTQHAVRVPLPGSIRYWSIGLTWLLKPSVAISPFGTPKETPVRVHGAAAGSDYRLEIDAAEGPRAPSTDTFQYTYGLSIPRIACSAADASSAIIATGIFGPLQTALVYQEQFAARQLKGIVELPIPTANNFSALQFTMQSFGTLSGQIIRGNVEETSHDDALEPPRGTVFDRPPSAKAEQWAFLPA